MIKVDNKEITFGGQLCDIQEENSQLLNRLYRIARENDVADQFDKAMIAAVLVAGVKNHQLNWQWKYSWIMKNIKRQQMNWLPRFKKQ